MKRNQLEGGGSFGEGEGEGEGDLKGKWMVRKGKAFFDMLRVKILTGYGGVITNLIR